MRDEEFDVDKRFILSRGSELRESRDGSEKLFGIHIEEMESGEMMRAALYLMSHLWEVERQAHLSFLNH